MNTDSENAIYGNFQKLPKEYLILQYKMSINKELMEEKIITYDIFRKMQNILIKKMNDIIKE